jgi:hypothetical protein
MSPSTVALLALSCCALVVRTGVVAAESFAYPAVKPSITARATPAWLPGSQGDDGYVTVKAQVVMPNLSCVGLGSSGGLFAIGQEKMQVVASLTTSGLKNSLDGQEVPIATFDGRSTPGQCAVLSTLPLIVVPYARLEPFSAANPGSISLLLNIKSSTDANVNLVGAAQVVLGAVAVFATGGAASTVAGLTTTIAKPALTTLQTQVNTANSNVTPGQTKIDFTWPDVRNGIQTISVPVYLAKTNFGETTAQAIARLQSAQDTSGTKLFDIVLTFTYTKSLFDPRASGATDLPRRDTIASASVLNYPSLPGIPNFLQTLNGSSPSLLQTISTAPDDNTLATACGTALELLRGQVGLNQVDRAIVIKAFVDEARKGPLWYSQLSTFNMCFRDYPDMQAMVRNLYGPVVVDFHWVDAQDGTGDAYESWLKRVVPILESFRNTMEVPDDRATVLLAFNGGADIPVDLLSGTAAWDGAAPMGAPPVPGAVGGEPKDSHPGITHLASKKITAGGCYVFAEASNLDPQTPGGHLILVGGPADIWVANVYLATSGNGKLTKIQLFKMTDSWKTFFKGNTYSGGECKASILNML